jgi:phage protein D/phage baseplate assembly protein gpV
VKRVQDLPQVTLSRDGIALTPDETRGLSEVTVSQALSVPTQCELIFRDPPGPLELPLSLLPGMGLDVSIRGYDEALFEGDVTAVEHVFDADAGREVRVRAYDRSHRLRKRQSVRAHVQVSARGLASELAADAELEVDAEADGPTHELLMQHRQTNLELLVEVLERCGLFYAVRGDRLHLLTLEGIGDPLPLALGETLLEARLELNGDPACRQVEVAGWDARRPEAYRTEVTSARSGRDTPAEVLPQDVGGDGTRSFPGEAAADDSHAEALAQAELDVRQAREVTLWAVAEGDPRLRPGALVDVAGVSKPFTGRHVLTTVTHTIDDRVGYVATVESAPPRLRSRPSAASVTEAIVTQVGDPDQRGRVKARLPGYFDVETGWMDVVTLGAGKDKGLQVLPDVDDTVLVLLAHGDPAEGVVLGGLYGAAQVPDAGGVVGGSIKRFQIRTPGGQVVKLDDEQRSVRVEDVQGSFVELTPEKVTLHATCDMEISAPGKRILIRGAAIDFEEA